MKNLWKIRPKTYFKIILKSINKFGGPRWVQVSAEFPIKNYQTRINLYSKKLIIRHIVLCPRAQYKSYSRSALRALARTAYSPGRFAARLERLTRAFGARARCSPRYHAAIQKYTRQSARPICHGPCPPLLGRLLRTHSAPSRNNTYRMRRLTVHKNSLF
jgi:hypothetical protein